MPVITLLRGFKVHYGVLDRFLRSHGTDETYGLAPVTKAYDSIANLLGSLMGKETDSKAARLVMPSRVGYDQATYAYIAYCWVHTYAQREINITEELPDTVPPEFESLREEVLKFDTREGFEERGSVSGKMGLYQVVTEDRSWAPPTVLPINETRSPCGQCNEVFDTFSERQMHRREVHSSVEGLKPVPNI